MNLKNKLNVYALLTVTLSLFFVSIFGFITYKQIHRKPKRKAVIHHVVKEHHAIKPIDLQENKKLLLLYKLNEYRKNVIDKKVEQTSYHTVKGIMTAYVAMCESACTGITRIGYDVRDTVYYHGMRIIATDPKVIPLYSIVEISYGDTNIKAIAIDTGGKINGKHVDLLMRNKSNAVEFGVKDVDIKIIREGKAG